MAVITYPLLTVVDDSGAVVSGATVSIASVKDKSGTDVASPGATVNQSGANVSVDYDAEAKGEAWVVLSVSKAGSTFTGLNAAPAFYLAKDSGRTLTALPAAAPGGSGGLPTADAGNGVKVSVGTGTGQLNTTLGAVLVGGYATGQDPATLVLDVAIAGHESAGSVGAAIAAAGGSGDPWATALPGAYAAGTAGYLIGTYLDAAVSGCSTYDGGPVASVVGDVGGNVVGSVGSVAGNVDGSVASVTAAVTVGSNNDKAGYALSAAGLDQVAVEAGLNARQSLAVIAAACAGEGGTTSAAYKGAGVATTRISFTASSGERSSITLSPPA